MGIVGWCISFPCVLIVGLCARYISIWIWGQADIEQVAVKQLKLTMGIPYLFGLMAFAIIIVVPVMEELLFRGFLQNFLKRYLGRNWAMVLAAVIFALAHFSPSQGVGNFQLILSLLALSFFLSFIYEREQTLFASMALHMAFNGFSVMLITL